MIKKILNVKAKVALRLYSSTKKMDQKYLRANWSANSIIAKSQGNALKDFQVEEPKPRGLKSSSSSQRSSESTKKA